MAMQAQAREQGRYLGGRRPTGTGSLTPDPTPTGSRAMGPAPAPARPGPGHRTTRGMDLRPAAGRAQHRRHRPSAQRDGCAVSLGRRPRTQPPSPRRRVAAADRGGDPGQPPLHRPTGVEPSAQRPRTYTGRIARACSRCGGSPPAEGHAAARRTAPAAAFTLPWRRRGGLGLTSITGSSGSNVFDGFHHN